MPSHLFYFLSPHRRQIYLPSRETQESSGYFICAAMPSRRDGYGLLFYLIINIYRALASQSFDFFKSKIYNVESGNLVQDYFPSRERPRYGCQLKSFGINTNPLRLAKRAVDLKCAEE